jgi:hypothetical protein
LTLAKDTTGSPGLEARIHAERQTENSKRHPIARLFDPH